MVEKHIGRSESKGIFYAELEQFAREKIRGHLQDLLEQEVSEWLGREKSERKVNADEQPGYRNGYGRRRRLTLSLGTIEIQRPRVRELSERFKSKVLPMFRRHTQEVRDLMPELYLHGLASGDFELALRHLLGEGAPLSASSLQRLKERWQNEYTQWTNASIEQARWAYLWADGIYVKAGLGKEKVALLVVIGVKSDGSKCFLALEAGHRESKESWACVLRQLKGRGLKEPRLFVGDGNLGLWAAVSEVYPQAQQQLCWNHKMLNVIDTVSRKEQSQVKRHLQAMMYAESREQALAERKKIRTSVSAQSQDDQDGSGELGAADDVLRLSPRALETPADIERRGVTVFPGAAPNRRVAAIQIAAQRDLLDLEDAHDSRDEL